jgi:hypothetical protein
VSNGDADWRLTGQEGYLKGALVVRKPYLAYSDTWNHDHCSFCWATFAEPDEVDAFRGDPADPREVLTEGYATTSDHPRGADYYWICPRCFDDFVDRFGWRVVDP